ncbi:choice-of-anchor J domain-containing protein [Conexibacter woesei]|uniref:choice-of-anchor J domain-containing protein n=1 Tax=Conexibacter woesei TaxID=191495 RepID=UPI0003083EFA|nr:choice-of-anchor J domain-containing protein [Conexibacter woesei]
MAAAVGIAVLTGAAPGVAQADLSQNFDPGVGPGSAWAPAGWTGTNRSMPLGSNSWFQGNPPSNAGPFPAHEGVESSYIAVNYNSTTGGSGTISNWLITPQITTLSDGDDVSFYTRTAADATEYPDRLEVRVATGGTCSPGATATGLGDFTTLLLSVNPSLSTGVYPRAWTRYDVTLRGLPAGTSTGCIAFRYHVTSSGPVGSNGNYIGIDTFSFVDDVTPPAAPSLTGLSPASPGNVAEPRATGTAEDYATVRIYGDSSCSGPVLGSGTAAQLAAGGVAFDAAADATTTPYATATDGSDNVSPCSAAGSAYFYDATAPTTTDDVPAQWQTAPIEVRLAAGDGSGSGVAATYYTVGENPSVPTTASAVYDDAAPPLLGNGERIRYFSVDVAGNAETPRTSEPARVDQDAPTTTDDVTAATRPGDAVRLTAGDGSGSGVVATHYTVGADPQEPTTASSVYDGAAPPVLGAGERIRYFSVDVVGNAESPRSSAAVPVPPEPRTPEPRTPEPRTPEPRAPAPRTPAPPLVTLTERPAELTRGRAARIGFAVDPSVAAYECRLNNGQWDRCRSPFDLTGLRAGDHRVEIRGIAADGRSGPVTVHLFQANPYPPGISLAAETLRATRAGAVAARLGCSPREGEGRGRCIGTVRITYAATVKPRGGGRAARRVSTLAQAPIDLAAGATTTPRLTLSTAGRRALAAARDGRLDVRVVVQARDLAGNRTLISFARQLERAGR